MSISLSLAPRAYHDLTTARLSKTNELIMDTDNSAVMAGGVGEGVGGKW